jgi:ATPase subunit of ABC transporter with duplicated ATPase domains
MTPDLMQEGEQRLASYQQREAALRTESGGRNASLARPVVAGEVDVTHGRILYLEDVHVSFDGFKAINGLNLDIAPGELRCIIGPNGAGKTTMMDIITGKTRPDSGTVFFGSTIDLLRYKEPEIAHGHWPQVPEAHGVRAAQRVREPGAGAQDPQALPPPCCSSSAARRRTALPRCCTPFIWQAA